MTAPANLLCSACKYSLRGLDEQGNCPECGQSIRRSIAALRSVRRRRYAGRDAIVFSVGGGYLALNVALVLLFMELDPFLIFHTWGWFVCVGPTVMILGALLLWLTERNFHWITLLTFVVAMPVIGRLNFLFMSMCADSV